jgi:hypothetical protein
LIFSIKCLTPKKKKGEDSLVLLVVYLFLSIRMSTIPIAMIAASDAPPRPSTYASVGGAGVGDGVGVASGVSSTVMAVTAVEGQ